MVIVYESITGFTKKYAEMLAAKTGFSAYPLKMLLNVGKEEEVLFLGWIKAGSIQGLNKVKSHKLKAVCATGTARKAEPSEESIQTRHKIQDVPFFYLRGGCLPLTELKGLDKFLMKMFVRMLKSRKQMNEELNETIYHIEHGFDGVKEENLNPVLEYIRIQK